MPDANGENKNKFDLTDQELLQLEITRQAMQRAVDAMLEGTGFGSKEQALPPITSGDVLDAHEFIQSLGADWAQHLPPVTIRRNIRKST